LYLIMSINKDGFVKVHQPCPCGQGSDNTGINADGSAYCFTCSKYFKNYGDVDSLEEKQETVIQFSDQGEFKDIPDRKISEETCKTYGVRVIEGSNGIIQHIYPYFADFNTEVARKIRYTQNKSFTFSGAAGEAHMFGCQAFKAGGKYLTVCEGELDAMAAHQMTGNRWPCISLKNGASGAPRDFKRDIEYLESFDNVILCFDMDKPGQEAARKVAKLLKPGKCKVMKLPEGFKDANDMLIRNESQRFVQCFWNAETYTPSGIVNVTNFKEKFFTEESVESIPYPWDGLNHKLDGLRKKELITLTGGTGLGKSSVTRELEHWLLTTTDEKVGVMALEEDCKRTVMGIVSIEAESQLFRDKVRQAYPEAKIHEHYTKLFEGPNADRLFVHAHLGFQDIDDIFAKLRYLIIGCDCQWVVVDHLHMLVAAHTEGDERRTIDDIMLRLRSLVEETGCGMVLVSHLRRTSNDKGHEQGIEVSLSHLRGSQSIAQLSDTVIALERNQQADDARLANTTVLRVLKSRHTGDTGKACNLYYDPDTGRLSEVEDVDEFDIEDEGWQLK